MINEKRQKSKLFFISIDHCSLNIVHGSLIFCGCENLVATHAFGQVHRMVSGFNEGLLVQNFLKFSESDARRYTLKPRLFDGDSDSFGDAQGLIDRRTDQKSSEFIPAVTAGDIARTPKLLQQQAKVAQEQVHTRVPELRV